LRAVFAKVYGLRQNQNLASGFAFTLHHDCARVLLKFLSGKLAELRACLSEKTRWKCLKVFDLFSERLRGENRARKFKNAQEILPDFEREHATDF
jgi:hypothetical protein